MSDDSSRKITIEGINFRSPVDRFWGAAPASVPGIGYGSYYVDTLIYGGKWVGTPTYTFLPSGYPVRDTKADTSDIFISSGYTEVEKNAFRKIVAEIEKVADIKFIEIPFDPDDPLLVNQLLIKAPSSYAGIGSALGYAHFIKV